MISPELILLRLVLATLLGAVVGLERGRLERAAGLRTHAMVSLAAALLMIVSAFGFADVRGLPDVVLDPSRVAAQVVSGIGFLGAGTIILRREVVRGLTTAASVWSVAAIGLAVGGGLYFAAVFATLLALLVLAGMKPLETRLYTRQRAQSIKLTIKDNKLPSLQAVRSAFDEADLKIDRLGIQPGKSSNQSTIELVIRAASPEKLLGVIETLHKMPGVVGIESAVNTANLRGARKMRPKDGAERVVADTDETDADNRR